MTPELCRRIKFHVSSQYDEREVEELFRTIEERGAFYRGLEGEPGWHELLVPQEVGWEPFYHTLLACDSLDEVSCYVEFCSRAFRIHHPEKRKFPEANQCGRDHV